MSQLAFDIETIPQIAPLTKLQKTTLDQKLDKELKYLYPTTSVQDLPEEVITEVKRKQMAINPFFGQIVCIGLYDPSTDESTATCSVDEVRLLKDFWRDIESADQFYSFNGMDFDVPYILLRSAHHGIIPPTVRGKSHPFLDRKKYNIKPHFDLYKLISDWGGRTTATLDQVTEFLGIKSPKGGEVVAATVEKFLLEGKYKLIEEYCLRDVMATYEACMLWVDYVNKPKY